MSRKTSKISDNLTSQDKEEVEKFSNLADQWWDEEGKFKPLHILNPTRIEYIIKSVTKHFGLDPNAAKPLAGLKILDVGCGGGLLSEPMARLGAKVVGIDASEKGINVAKLHSKNADLDIAYHNSTIEDFVSRGERFDIVLAMEIIEHVANTELFIKSIKQLLKPSGLVYVATLNRTVKSFLTAIVGAEYILGWLPKGTHEWSKFMKPSEISKLFDENEISLKEIQGMSYNIFRSEWKLTAEIDVNFIMLGTSA